MSEQVYYVTSNDRYQVVSVAARGTTTTPPEFRYWNAAAPAWSEAVGGDTRYPAFYTLNELGDYVPGSIEFTFVDFKGQEASIDGVLVEFNTRPSSISEGIASTYPIGFTASVQGYGVPNYSRTVSSSQTTGMHTSTSVSFVGTAGYQANEPWPNTRSAFLPLRMDQRVRNARVILSDIHLVEIVKVDLIGTLIRSRTV